MDPLVEVARVLKASGVKNHTSPPRACLLGPSCEGDHGVIQQSDAEGRRQSLWQVPGHQTSRISALHVADAPLLL
jgi:hypothetical protein